MEEKFRIDGIVSKLIENDNIEVDKDKRFQFDDNTNFTPDLYIHNKLTNKSLLVEVYTSGVVTSTGYTSLPIGTITSYSEINDKLHVINPNSEIVFISPSSVSEHTVNVLKKFDMDIISIKNENSDEIANLIYNKTIKT
jgi:hypothetical protein